MSYIKFEKLNINEESADINDLDAIIDSLKSYGLKTNSEISNGLSNIVKGFERLALETFDKSNTFVSSGFQHGQFGLQNSGYVKVVGRKIFIKNPENYILLSKSASDVECLPKTDGVIELTFTYYER